MSSAHRNPFYITQRAVLLAKTCPKCGLLLGAEWFHRYEGHYRSWCRQCEADKRSVPKTVPRSDFHLRCQEASLPAPRNRQPWTESDYKVLADPSKTVLEKALQLQRSYYATNNRAHAMRYPSKTQDRLDNSAEAWVIKFDAK